MVINSNSDYLYYVLGTGLKPNNQSLYETFEPNIFQNNRTVTVNDPHNRGAKLHVWCDNAEAETETQVTAGIYNSLRVLAQKDWGSGRLTTSYSQFTSIISTIGSAPPYSTSISDIAATNKNLPLENSIIVSEATVGTGSFSVWFNLNSGQDVLLNVYTILGQKVYGTNLGNATSRTTTVSMGRTSPGLFLCTFSFGDIKITKKLAVR